MKNYNLLNEYIELLKQEGFNVYKNVESNVPFVNASPNNYVFFEKLNQIGYVQTDYYFGLNFSSVHKPCREFGTGFSIHRNVELPTIKYALDCFIDDHRVKKYESFEEYKRLNKILTYVQI